MKVYILIISLLQVSILGGCKEEVNFRVSNQENIKLFLYKNKKSFGPYRLRADSPEFTRIKNWISKNQKGWKEPMLLPADSIITPITIINDEFRLQISNDEVILKYKDKFYVKDIQEKEFQYLMDFNTREEISH